MRNAESDRDSTCDLADSVATLVLNAYRASKPFQEGRVPAQTVVAGFVLVSESNQSLNPYILETTNRAPASAWAHTEDGTCRLLLLSFGAGTKFACDNAVAMSKDGRIVRDCHAEILARRGLQRLLWRELEKAQRGMNSILIPCHHECSTAAQSSSPTGAAASIQPPLCSFSAPDLPQQLPTRRFILLPGCRLILYSSSMPCGNASLKRWAKGKAERRRPELGEGGMPLEPHEVLHVTAREEGQVALLCKGQPKQATMNSATTSETKATTSTTGAAQVVVRSKGRLGTVAPGTSRPQDLVFFQETAQPSKTGVTAKDSSVDAPTATTPSLAHTQERVRPAGTMSCSDKICRWSALGLQGALLSRWLAEPLRLHGVVVGRKFSFEHCRRALCCRLSHDLNKKRHTRAPQAPSFSAGVPGKARAEKAVENDSHALHARGKTEAATISTVETETAMAVAEAATAVVAEPMTKIAKTASKGSGCLDNERHGEAGPSKGGDAASCYGAVVHPSLMGTSVKLDTKVIHTKINENPASGNHNVGGGGQAEADTGAQFGAGGAETPCLVWAFRGAGNAMGEPLCIDGPTGKPLPSIPRPPLPPRQAAAEATRPPAPLPLTGSTPVSMISPSCAESIERDGEGVSRRAFFKEFLCAIRRDANIDAAPEGSVGEAVVAVGGTLKLASLNSPSAASISQPPPQTVSAAITAKLTTMTYGDAKRQWCCSSYAKARCRLHAEGAFADWVFGDPALDDWVLASDEVQT